MGCLESIGEKVAAAAKGDNDEMAKALVARVTEARLDIDDLEIEFAGGVATISGLAADDAAIEKAILIVGNTEGVSEVEADGFVAGVTDAEKAEYTKARTEAMNRPARLRPHAPMRRTMQQRRPQRRPRKRPR